MKHVSRQSKFAIAATLVVAMALALAVPQRAAAQEKVNLGYLAVISFAPLFLAEDKGFLKEQGVKVEYKRFVSGAKMMAPLATGQLQVAAGAVSAGFFNALAGGTDIMVVADKGQNRPGFGYNQLVVRKDLIDSGRVKTIKDLKGLKVAPNAPANIAEYWVRRALENVGLSLKDLKISYISFPKQVIALRTKAIDAAITAEPWGIRIEEQGLGVRFASPDTVGLTKPMQVAAIMYSGKFARERRSVAQKYMNAYVKAVHYFNARGLKNPEILDILVKWTKVPKKTITAAVPFYLDKDAVPHVASIDEMQDFLIKWGSVKKKVPMSKIADLSFVKKASAMK